MNIACDEIHQVALSIQNLPAECYIRQVGVLESPASQRLHWHMQHGRRICRGKKRRQFGVRRVLVHGFSLPNSKGSGKAFY